MENEPIKLNFRYDLLLYWVVLVLPVVVWFGITPVVPRFSSTFTTLINIGQLTGLVGMTLVALSMILQIRLNLLNKIFARPQTILKLHHNSGLYGLILLLIHPIVLAIRFLPTSIDSAFNFFFGWNLVNLSGLIALLLMIISLFVTLFYTSSFKHWKFFHQILLLAYLFIVYHLLFVTSDISRNPILRFYLLGLTLLGGLAFGIQKTIYLLKRASK